MPVSLNHLFNGCLIFLPQRSLPGILIRVLRRQPQALGIPLNIIIGFFALFAPGHFIQLAEQLFTAAFALFALAANLVQLALTRLVAPTALFIQFFARFAAFLCGLQARLLLLKAALLSGSLRLLLFPLPLLLGLFLTLAGLFGFGLALTLKVCLALGRLPGRLFALAAVVLLFNRFWPFIHQGDKNRHRLVPERLPVPGADNQNGHKSSMHGHRQPENGQRVLASLPAGFHKHLPCRAQALSERR